MPYQDLQSLSAGEFKRFCGVNRETLGEMVEVRSVIAENPGRRKRLG
ncbi:hypothetical protein [Thermoleptolyngbya sichuanensis]|nr:hypothetical protein [Thermoleptolyngbya sichuanensis]